MLKVRVIPTLLWKDLGLVKGVGFNSWRRVGAVLPALKVYNMRDVDELVLQDITATTDAREPDWASVSDFADACSVPFTVGGGIRRLDEIASLLRSGADKISLNTVACETPEFVDESATRFGAQCVVASIDVRRDRDGEYSVFTHCGTRATGRKPVPWARELEARGAGEILLTSIERDGTMSGYDLRVTEMVAAAVGVPVIASGGCGSYQHMVDVIRDAGASAVAAASMFHFTEQTPAGAKQALHEAGIPVRRNFVAA
jgi:imidazole glycerol-phosphate synthase subunit HisF